MRTWALLSLLTSAGLVCLTSGGDVEPGVLNSSFHLPAETHHFHLHKDPSEDRPETESYSTEDPHKDQHHHHHHKPTAIVHSERTTTESLSTENEELRFFRAGNEENDVHIHHMQADADQMKPRTSVKEGSVAASHHGRTMDASSDMHTMDNHDMPGKHDHDMNMNKNDSSMSHDMMMMIMYFHTGVSETVLFEWWKITTVGGLLGSMVGIFLLAMLYEGLKYYREHLFKKYVSSIQFSTVAVTGESGRVTQVHKVERHHMLSLSHAAQTALHVVQIIMSYFLMLIFMTYNVWLCLSVVLGAGVGYFVFGWKKATVVDITEHCH